MQSSSANTERRTYLSTEESAKDVEEEIEQQLRLQQPLTKSILAYFQMNPIVIANPENFKSVYEKISNALLNNVSQLQQLVLTALDPAKVKVTSSKLPCLSAIVLKNSPKLVLQLLEKGNEAIVLFQFLKDLQNQTSLGYFSQIFDHEQQYFQSCLLKFFAGSAAILQICFQSCHYEQVFLVIVNAIHHSQDAGLLDFKKQLFARLLNKSMKIERPPQLIQNIMNMMGMILQNILYTREGLLQMIFDSIEPAFISKLVSIIIENYKEKPHIVEYQLRILGYVLAIYKVSKYKKLPLNLSILESSIITIIKQFDKFIPILLEQPQQKLKFPNGELVPRVGLIRYYILVLFRDILNQEEQLVFNNMLFNLNKHKIIQIYLSMNKWNNMVHHVVEEIAIRLLKFERISKSNQKFTRCKQFLDYLIAKFKASEYIFLGTAHTSSYGNIYYIYNIAREVAVELQSTSQLQEILRDLKPLQKFITADLQNFQIKMDTSLSQNSTYMIKSKPDSIKKLVRKMSSKQIEEVHKSNKKTIIEDEVTDFIYKKQKKAQDLKNRSF